MQTTLNLATLVPIIRSISSVTPGEEPRTWDLSLNRNRYEGLRVTPVSLTTFLSGMGIEILKQEGDQITVRIPSDQDLETYIQGQLTTLRNIYNKRPLTPEEIEDIVSVIPRVYSPVAEIAEHARGEIIDRMREQLAEITLTPLAIPDLKDTIINRFERARVEPGETVGLTVAEALSALTQAALNAFHQSGARSSVTAGIEMLKDLLAVRPERKFESCNVHFWDKDLTFEQVYAKRVDIVAVPVGGHRYGLGPDGVVIDYTIDAPGNFGEYWWVTLYPQLTGKQLPKTSSIVQLQLNTNRMVAHDITMEDVASAIRSYNTPEIVTVITGPFDSGLIFVYPDEVLVYEPLRNKKIPITANVAETFLSEIFIPTLPNILIKGIPGIRSINPTITTTWSVVEDEIRVGTPEVLETISDPDQRLLVSRSWTLHLSRYVTSREGITREKLVTLLVTLGYEIVEEDELYLLIIAPNDDIPSKYVSQRVAAAEEEVANQRRERVEARRQGNTNLMIPPVQEETRTISRAGRYIYAQTQGSNLTALFARSDVDTRRTVSNNPSTILRLLGIEAARNLLIHEFISILENAQLGLDPRHIILLADFMTNRGTLLPVSFWGMVRSNPGPLTVASFGKAINIYRTAGAFGQSERILTTTSTLYVGQRGTFGTGYVDLRIDEARIKAFEEEMARKELAGQETLNPQDIENAIEQLDRVTFGAEIEMQAADPLAELAALNAEIGPVPTQVGTGTIPAPIEIIKPAPLISPLVERNLEKIQVATPLPVPETVITVEEAIPPTRRALPLPTRIAPTIRRPGLEGTRPPTGIPRARLPLSKQE